MLKKLAFVLPLLLLFACGDDDIDVDAGPPDAEVVDMEEAKEATVDVVVVDEGTPEDAEPEVAGD
jgi:hypothetical protein